LIVLFILHKILIIIIIGLNSVLFQFTILSTYMYVLLPRC